MERRKFLWASLLLAPVASFAKWADLKIFNRPTNGFIIRATDNRFFGKKSSGATNYGRCIISGGDTDGLLYLSDSGSLSFKEKGGPALHIHHKEDEIFYVVSGEFLFQIGDEVFLAKTGDTAFIPRGTAHTFANFIENNPGRMITIHQPITPELEKFYELFSRVGYMNQEDVPKHFTPEEFKNLMADNTFVGPQIDIDAALKKLNYKKN